MIGEAAVVRLRVKVSKVPPSAGDPTFEEFTIRVREPSWWLITDTIAYAMADPRISYK